MQGEEKDADHRGNDIEITLPWGLEKNEMKPGSMATLTDDKLARFVIGQQKKSKFEREKEEREARKKRADEEAAKIYEMFVASFEGDDDQTGKTFVRGEIIQKGRGTHHQQSQHYASNEKDSLYRLEGQGSNQKKMSDMDRIFQKEDKTAFGGAQSHSLHQPQKKKKQIDIFLEEIKSRTPVPPTADEQPGNALETDDSTTTNLYVGNLPPSITEETLQELFGKFGKIYSIKIMWPRSEEERLRKKLSGFVSFFRREDANEARIQLHEEVIDGYEIYVGWGKSVKIDPQLASLAAAATMIQVEIPTDLQVKNCIDRLALTVSNEGISYENAIKSKEANNPMYGFLSDPISSLGIYYRWRVYCFAMEGEEALDEWKQVPFKMTSDGPMWVPPPCNRYKSKPSGRNGTSSRSGSTHRRPRSRGSRSRSRSRNRVSSRSGSRSTSRSRSRSRSQSRSRSRGRRGKSSRNHSRSRSHSRRRSPSSSSTSSSEHDYYQRNKDHSFNHNRKRTRDPSVENENVKRHTFPRHNSRRHSCSRSGSGDRNDRGSSSLLTGQQLARARDRERGRETNRLPDEAYDKFIDILKELTLEREAVKRAMGFALDNSEASVDIVQILVQHFKKSKEEGASAIMKVAWFYLTSDILHNSSAAMKNASLYRTTLQDYLPEIMDHLRQAQKRITGRMSANAMKEKILNVLTAWESWSLFPPLYLVGLNATFLRKQDAQTFNDESLESGSQDDEETLRKKCKQAGIMWDGSSKTLQMRLQWLKEFTAPKSTASSQTKKKAVRGEQEEDLDGEPMYENEQTEITAEGLDGKPIDDDDFDGEPMDDEDLDGAPLDEDEEDLDGAPLDEDEEDLNGAPLDEEEEPLDGAPLDDDEDLDGQPL